MNLPNIHNDHVDMLQIGSESPKFIIIYIISAYIHLFIAFAIAFRQNILGSVVNICNRLCDTITVRSFEINIFKSIKIIALMAIGTKE